MKQRFLLLLLFVCALACDSANPVAPTGTILSLSASPTQISLNGGTSLLTVTGFKPDGNPLNPGTQITLSTDIGVLSSTLVETNGSGRATAILTSDGTPGVAMISARPASGTGGEGTGAMATVQIGQTDTTRPQLTVTASPSTVGLGERATVTAVARNADGSLFGAGGSVLLRTDLGFFDTSGSCSSGSNSVTLTTSSASEARTFLCAGQQPGTANITGTFGASAEATATVTIENQRPSLIINANPNIISPLETSQITIIARDENDVPLGAGFQIQLLASFGQLDPETPTTDQDGRATATFDPNDEFGDAVIQAFLGSSEVVSVTVTVNPEVVSVQFVTLPGSINVENQTLRLVARALNSRNEGVSSVIAVYTAVLEMGGNRIGEFQLPSGDSSDGSVVTGNDGTAPIDLVLEEVDLMAGNDILVTVTVSTESGSVTSPEGRIRVN